MACYARHANRELWIMGLTVHEKNERFTGTLLLKSHGGSPHAAPRFDSAVLNPQHRLYILSRLKHSSVFGSETSYILLSLTVFALHISYYVSKESSLG